MYIIESRFTKPEAPGIFFFGNYEDHHVLKYRLIPAALGAAATNSITQPEAEDLIMHLLDDRRAYHQDAGEEHLGSYVTNELKPATAQVMGNLYKHLDSRKRVLVRQAAQGLITSAQLIAEATSIAKNRLGRPYEIYITKQGVQASSTALAGGEFVPRIKATFPNSDVRQAAEEHGATHVVTKFDITQGEGQVQSDSGELIWPYPHIGSFTSNYLLCTLVDGPDKYDFEPVLELTSQPPRPTAQAL
jgi:hypothetical protein